MRALFFCPWANADLWLGELRAAAPEIDFRVWPEIGPAEAIQAAVVWRPPAGLFDGLTGLSGVCVLGAGVDHLFQPGRTPPDVPITRLVDPRMAERMASWVLAAVLHHHRHLGRYARQQPARIWRQIGHQDTADVRIGVMGLGPMGRASAALLARVGYRVAGWSRRPPRIDGVVGFAGAEGWAAFLARSDVLVCQLPLTPATRGILDRATFERLPAGAVVINGARGEHVVEADLLAALESGQVAGAVLDAFAVEPLPPDHPFWARPEILITPHVASLSVPASGAAQIAAQLRDLAAGRTPDHLIDRRDHGA